MFAVFKSGERNLELIKINLEVTAQLWKGDVNKWDTFYLWTGGFCNFKISEIFGCKVGHMNLWVKTDETGLSETSISLVPFYTEWHSRRQHPDIATLILKCGLGAGRHYISWWNPRFSYTYLTPRYIAILQTPRYPVFLNKTKRSVAL